MKEQNKSWVKKKWYWGRWNGCRSQWTAVLGGVKNVKEVYDTIKFIIFHQLQCFLFLFLFNNYFNLLYNGVFNSTWNIQQYVNHELPDVQAGFRKAEEPEIKLPTFAGSLKKQESSRKISIYALLTMPNLFTLWITTNCEKFFKRWEYQTTWPAFWEICLKVKKQQLELDVEQKAGSKVGKEYFKAAYCHTAYLT